MKFSTTSVLSLVVAIAAASPVSLETRQVAPSFSVTKTTYSGTGCPAGTVDLVKGSDPTAITLRMRNYVAEIGPGIPLAESRKNCVLNLEVLYPENWQYSVIRTRYVGQADLDRPVRGLQKATYWFAGQSNQVSAETPFIGPWKGTYDLVDTIETDKFDWSPCGKRPNLNINSQIRMTSWDSKAHGLMSTNFEQIHELQWRRC